MIKSFEDESSLSHESIGISVEQIEALFNQILNHRTLELAHKSFILENLMRLYTMVRSGKSDTAQGSVDDLGRYADLYLGQDSYQSLRSSIKSVFPNLQKG